MNALLNFLRQLMQMLNVLLNFSKSINDCITTFIWIAKSILLLASDRYSPSMLFFHNFSFDHQRTPTAPTVDIATLATEIATIGEWRVPTGQTIRVRLGDLCLETSQVHTFFEFSFRVFLMSPPHSPICFLLSLTSFLPLVVVILKRRS